MKDLKISIRYRTFLLVLAEYYAGDPAFMGVSISNYDTYKDLPVEAESERKKSVLPGFEMLSVLLAGLGAFAFLKAKKK